MWMTPITSASSPSIGTHIIDRIVRLEIDSLASNRDTVDIMPNGIATADWNLSLVIKTTGGAAYAKSVKVSRGGLVRVNNR